MLTTISQQPYMLWHVPLCLAQDGESTDVNSNCLVFWAHCENKNFLIIRQVYNRGFSPNLAIFVHKYLNNRTCYDKIVLLLFCSAQDGESTVVNCLVFWAHCENGQILMKRQVYNKGIFTILGISSQYEILILLECAFDSEWNGVINSVILCLVVELFVHTIHVTDIQWTRYTCICVCSLYTSY